jgi:hypothetical protein
MSAQPLTYWGKLGYGEAVLSELVVTDGDAAEEQSIIWISPSNAALMATIHWPQTPALRNRMKRL